MPRLIRLYLSSIAIGAALGVLFTIALLALDIAGLRHLLLGSPAGLIGLFLLTFFHAALFSGVQFGVSVMLMNLPGTPPTRGRRVISRATPALAVRPVQR